MSKPVALSFAKRTLSRCRKFEDSRTSCFSEPVLHDIIFAAPPRINEADLLAGKQLLIKLFIIELSYILE